MDVLPDTCGRRRVRHLLLLYLFVMKAAADCSKPHARVNMVLNDQSLLRNDFPENTDVTLECANGYIRESGSGNITCIDGNWTEPDLICNKKDCGPPPPKLHMSFNTSAGTLFGATITVACEKGYELSGPRFKQCLAHGWTGRPKCEKVTCEVPAEVLNGRSSWTSEDYPEYLEIIQYECDEGYTLVGNETITCTDTGVFDFDPPECKGVTTESTVTNMVTRRPTPPAQEESTSTAATSTAHRDKTFTPSATPTVSPSPPGGRGILTAEERATPASVTSATPFEDTREETVDKNKDVGYVPVIVSVIAVTIVALICILFLHKYLLKRKGSYDTREDLKPELLQFQNL